MCSITRTLVTQDDARIPYLVREIIWVRDACSEHGQNVIGKKVLVGERRLGGNGISQLAGKPILRSAAVSSTTFIKFKYNTGSTRKISLFT